MPKVNPGFLEGAIDRARRDVARRRSAHPEAEWALRARGARPAREWARALAEPDGVAVIAEIKRRSPSAGPLAPGIDAAGRARIYDRHGAAALSVLTAPVFDGNPEDLEAVAAAVAVPILRKDFIIDPYQLWESRAHGADAALLIVAALDDASLRALIELAGEIGLGLLVEIHGPHESERALEAGANVIGVNARDLTTLEVGTDSSLEALSNLRRRAGPETVLVAESGIRSPVDVVAARAAGADAVLVGEHLMRAADPGAALAGLVQAGSGRP